MADHSHFEKIPRSAQADNRVALGDSVFVLQTLLRPVQLSHYDLIDLEIDFTEKIVKELHFSKSTNCCALSVGALKSKPRASHSKSRNQADDKLFCRQQDVKSGRGPGFGLRTRNHLKRNWVSHILIPV
jgi:hypothetical protein